MDPCNSPDEAELQAALERRYGARGVSLPEAVRETQLARLREHAAARRSGASAVTRRPTLLQRFLAPAGLAFAAAAMLAVAVLSRTPRPEPAGPSPHPEGVQLIHAPRGAQVPEGTLDPSGRLHLVYGLDDDGYYVQTGEDGVPVSRPVLLNHRKGTVSSGGERGPKFARGRDGSLHVVWLSHDPATPGVWYTRSTDGGRTFERERNIVDTPSSCESATVATDGEGRVWVFWLDGRLPPDPNRVMAAPIYMARSTDGGRTFTRNERVHHDHPGFACACCRLEARIGPDDHLYLSFRSAYRNVRDAFMLKGEKTANDFHTLRVSVDNWHLADCPGSGIPFSFDPDGRILASWMSRGRVYWSISEPGGARFGPRIPAPQPAPDENYPSVITNNRGDVLLVWQEGSRIRWAEFDRSGAFKGREGTTTAPEKPLAFVGKDGGFRLLL